MSVLTVGILAVISMQTTALKTQSRNKLSTNIQLIGQQIIEKVNANSIDDASILSYNGLKTQDSAPASDPAKTDHAYFSTILAGITGGYAEIAVTATRPYPVDVTVFWMEGPIKHKLKYSTYILPH